MRGTYVAGTTETSLVRDVSDRIALLQPDASPLITFLNALKRKKVATNDTFEWFEDDLVPTSILDASDSGTGTTLTVSSAHGAIVRNGDLLVAPNGELILVTSGGGSASLTVSRALGTTPAAFDLATGDQLIVIGNANEEGGSTPAYRYVQKSPKSNYIQIFRDPVKITVSEETSDSYGGDDRTHQRKKVAIEHKRGIELAFLLGNGSATADASSVGYRRTTKGLFNWISTNVTNAGGTLSEADFETFVRGVMRYGSSPGLMTKVMLASPIMVSALNFWAKQALQVRSDEKAYGMRVTTYTSGHGDIDFVRSVLLGDYTTGDISSSPLLSWAGYSFVLDMGNVRYRFKKTLDTKLHPDIQPKTEEYLLDEYRTHCGLECKQEKTHGVLSYVAGYAA
jgi:hypothetical protein